MYVLLWQKKWGEEGKGKKDMDKHLHTRYYPSSFASCREREREISPTFVRFPPPSSSNPTSAKFAPLFFLRGHGL